MTKILRSDRLVFDSNVQERLFNVQFAWLFIPPCSKLKRLASPGPQALLLRRGELERVEGNERVAAAEEWCKHTI
jgi:hypothetical protein